MKEWRSKAFFLLMASFLALSGCGGDDPLSSKSADQRVKSQSVMADAGPDQQIVTGSVVTLNGSGRADVGADHLDYTWGFVYRPSGSIATLSDSHGPNPSFLADKEGTYMLKLVVSDGTSDSSPDMISIRAQKQEMEN